jgi:hypothetical protein
MKLPSTAADVLTDARCSMSSPSTVESIDRLYLNVSSWSCRRRPTPQAPPARSPRATSRDRAVERGEMSVAHGLTALAAAVTTAPRMTADSPVSARPRQCAVRCTRVHGRLRTVEIEVVAAAFGVHRNQDKFISNQGFP